METGIPARLSPAEGRKFGLLVGGAFLVLGGISWWRGHPVSSKVFLGLGGALVVAGALVPAHLGPVYRAWTGLARVISKVTTPVFMGAVYFLVLTPIGLLRRAFSGNAMVHRPVDGSYWVAREPDQRQRRDMERQF